MHDPLDLALSTPSGHTAPTKIPATLQMAPLPVYQAPLAEKISLFNGLDLGGPPDLLPIPACRLPDCHHRIARASSQMHHRSKQSSLGLFPGRSIYRDLLKAQYKA